MLYRKMKQTINKIIQTVAVFLFMIPVCFSQDVEAPYILILSFECPRIVPLGSGDQNVLYNSDGVISGLGIESANGVRLPNPLFSGPALTGIPTDLSSAHYNRVGTAYDYNNGMITCSYASAGNYPPFNVTYVPAKSSGGIVYSQTPKSISIKLGFGFAAGNY